MKRGPAVAGQFYESSPERLSRQVAGFIDERAMKKRALGVVSPHAGLMYSGRVAGSVYSRIETPGTFIMLGPNHTGMGSPVSVMSKGEWEVPTGSLTIDEALAAKLKGHSPDVAALAAEDSRAHQLEHSLEVQLPFMLHFSPAVKILPIAMMSLSQEDCRTVGEALADVIQKTPYPVTIVASSDMSHYVSDAQAREKDRRAIDRILALDPEGLYRTVKKEGISMCGVVPATTMLFAVVKLGAGESFLVKYMTSGEVSGDFDYVVGYAGIIIS